ncbi:ketopantoate reductase family protein [Streptomyces sp. P9(2023)]|uniref:ketopantoate reductase family protein n=1 Tax=Streptomyces sp. P9(2023) TaxID=3064394 RepID=UPI0028F3F6F7|nr:ketopantoate reductase family protein [Streptomyces sp. P9(2023)]MDT9690037.1 ketopantoate reductase family protein [Streptomyces sp. P9(2023)]
MKILVVGAGATGGYFGALLARSGQDVTFLVRPRRAAALRERCLRVVGKGEEWSVEPRLVTADALTAPYDLVLLSVKSTALEQAIEDVAPAVGPDTAIVPLLNGLAHVDALNARFGATPVLGGVAKVVTTLDDAGDIVRLAPLAHLTIGEQDGTPSARVEKIRSVLTEAGIDVLVPADVMTAMWHKWVFITTFGAVTSLMRGTVGEVNAIAGGAELGPAVLAEAAAVSAAAGHPVPEAERTATLGIVTANGSPMVPSLYRDLVAGRPTEVEHLFGDLVARARALSVPTPLLDLATLHLRVHQARAGGAPVSG